MEILSYVLVVFLICTLIKTFKWYLNGVPAREAGKPFDVSYVIVDVIIVLMIVCLIYLYVV